MIRFSSLFLHPYSLISPSSPVLSYFLGFVIRMYIDWDFWCSFSCTLFSSLSGLCCHIVCVYISPHISCITPRILTAYLPRIASTSFPKKTHLLICTGCILFTYSLAFGSLIPTLRLYALLMTTMNYEIHSMQQLH